MRSSSYQDRLTHAPDQISFLNRLAELYEGIPNPRDQLRDEVIAIHDMWREEAGKSSKRVGRPELAGALLAVNSHLLADADKPSPEFPMTAFSINELRRVRPDLDLSLNTSTRKQDLLTRKKLEVAVPHIHRALGSVTESTEWLSFLEEIDSTGSRHLPTIIARLFRGNLMRVAGLLSQDALHRVYFALPTDGPEAAVAIQEASHRILPTPSPMRPF